MLTDSCHDLPAARDGAVMKHLTIERKLSRLAIGQAINLKFPDLQIVGRGLYLAVNGVAWRLFGANNYRIRKPRGCNVIWVARVAGRR